MQTLKVDQDWQARIIGKTLTLPKHEDIANAKLHGPNKTKVRLPGFE